MKDDSVSKTSSKKTCTDSMANIMFYIAGPKSFDNEILSEFLSDHIGTACICLENHNLQHAFNQFPDKKHIIFIDCKEITDANQLDGAKIDTTFNYPNTFFICFNLASDCGMERHILDQGVRGILYSHQTIDLYPVAIEKVLNGELWFPRIVLKEKLLAGSTPTTLPEITDTTLTMREKQVLNLLATGISNLEIANKLFLSTHTVKTHVYNIYRKIKVSNRLQAAVWMKNKQSNKISTSRNV